MADEVPESSAPVAGIRFTVGSRSQKRFANVQTVSPVTSGSFAPIPLPASGHVRRLRLEFTLTGSFASAGAAVTGDAPFNLISGITLTDATGQPVQQIISGFEQTFSTSILLPAAMCQMLRGLPRIHSFPPITRSR